jgi:hypothetical protein
VCGWMFLVQVTAGCRRMNRAFLHGKRTDEHTAASDGPESPLGSRRGRGLCGGRAVPRGTLLQPHREPSVG